MHPFIETKYAHISASQNTFHFIFVQLPRNDYWKQAKITWRLESCWFQVATWFSRKKNQTSQKRTGYSLPDRYTYLSLSRIFRNWATVIRDILSKNKVYMCVMYLSLKDKKVNFCPFTLQCSKFHMRSNSWNRQPQALYKCNIPYSSN